MMTTHPPVSAAESRRTFLRWLDPAHRYCKGTGRDTFQKRRSVPEQKVMAARGVDMDALDSSLSAHLSRTDFKQDF